MHKISENLRVPFHDSEKITCSEESAVLYLDNDEIIAKMNQKTAMSTDFEYNKIVADLNQSIADFETKCKAVTDLEYNQIMADLNQTLANLNRIKANLEKKQPNYQKLSNQISMSDPQLSNR